MFFCCSLQNKESVGDEKVKGNIIVKRRKLLIDVREKSVSENLSCKRVIEKEIVLEAIKISDFYSVAKKLYVNVYIS